jgi:hypothetical protein
LPEDDTMPPFNNRVTDYSKVEGEPSGSALSNPSGDPSLRQDQKDAQLVRVAPAELNGEYSAAPDGSNPVALEDNAPGAFASSSDLLFGRLSGQPRDQQEHGSE